MNAQEQFKVKESKMPRPAIEVNEAKLKQLIGDCESKKQYTTRSELWQDVALAYGASPAWVYQVVERLNIEVKTPKGKKGRQKGTKVASGVKVSRGVKFERSPIIKHSLLQIEAVIKQEQKGRFMPIFERMKAGSMKAAVTLKCLDCSSFQTLEIKHCPCENCPLHPFRPYQGSLSEEGENHE
jgi:hypothetical protein